ncbi:YceI family protein [Gordonia sp. NPDC003424]
MGDNVWDFTADDGSVTIHTGVTGRAARTGHRLTIEMQRWSASVSVTDGEPTGIEATIPVDSLHVVSGEGGLTPMAGPEKLVARGNAMKSLQPDKHPEITYVSSSMTKSDNGYHVDGTLTIHGRSKPRSLEFAVVDNGGTWDISTEAAITQSDFGIKPYSLMMGTLKVVDEVRVTVHASWAKERT